MKPSTLALLAIIGGSLIYLAVSQYYLGRYVIWAAILVLLVAGGIAVWQANRPKGSDEE